MPNETLEEADERWFRGVDEDDGDDPEGCPICGEFTDDPLGGPCRECWGEAPVRGHSHAE
jgi:hypothetical protein